MGRPSEFSQETASAICERLAGGESLRAICDDEAMPGQSTVFRWLAANDGFREQYAHAREAQAELLADQIVEIADDSANDYEDTENGPRLNQEAVARSRLRVEARKWVASKLKPKVYGERQQITGPDDGPLRLEIAFAGAKDRLTSQIAALVERGAKG